MAGGVALNCVANGKLLREGIFDELWIQPAAGDAGGALGAALAVWHNAMGARTPRRPAAATRCAARSSGRRSRTSEIRAWLDARGYPYDRAAGRGAGRGGSPSCSPAGQVVGLFQGRMEFGPRALGSRSILGDPRSPTHAVDHEPEDQVPRELPPVRAVGPERAGRRLLRARARSRPTCCWSPTSAATAGVPLAGDERGLDLEQWVNRVALDVPAVTHVDYSARIQTVDAEHQPATTTG